MFRPNLFLLWCAFFSISAQAKLNVITTTTDLRAIVAEVGGSLLTVDSIAKGTQDSHFIEAKPSFMVKANKADFIVAIGLDLEVGWLPSIIQGSRNPKVNVGLPGYLEVGALVEPLEVPTGNITRADGDVHPYGNPHIWLDPIRVGEVAVHVAKRLSELDPPNATAYSANAKALQTRLQNKTKDWQQRIAKTKIKKVVTYHKTLTYFLSRFGLENPAILEPKPGIPPTSGHIIDVIKLIQSQKVPLILVENYFDASVTKKIKQEVPGIRAETIPVSVEGAPGINSLDDLFENLVKTIEGK